MAIYNKWSEEISVSALRDELAEIYAGIREVTVGEVASNAFEIGFDYGYALLLGGSPGKVGVRIAGSDIYQSTATMSLSFKYYAKSNGEVLIATNETASAYMQAGIGKTSDGKWGAVLSARPKSSSAAYDMLIATGSGVVNKDPRNITNKGSTNINYIAIRHCVKYSDIVFDNFFFNTEGVIYPWKTFELNGELYVPAITSSENNTFLMKL